MSAPDRSQALIPETFKGEGTPANGERLLSLREASVEFGPVRALHGIDLDLRRGDRLALIGANGSGKTTLLRLLHGLVACTSGAVVAGSAAPPAAAMVFQKPFVLNLSARRNVWLGLWLRGVPWRLRGARCDEALRRVGLLGQAGRRASDLSGGQQQRLALARAWALRPDVLYLDEPTAALDPNAKREVETLITEIADDGVTVVMSSHNLGQVKRLANRVAFLAGGRLVVDLPVDRFFNGPLPDEAANFLKGELPWV